MIKLRYGNSFRGVAGRVWWGRSNDIHEKRWNIDTIHVFTTGIARWTLQQFYDYPGSDEPSDSFIQIYERFE